ncbi:hypothetical protein A9Q83_04680 [Alphaproteobacteria bacterium 46_93_T64]|nr:hypothetical protein A9Q83_04680 [Alphaproteobacteria bacterium 46_93_T64]
MKITLGLIVFILISQTTAQAGGSLIFSKPGPRDYSANISETVLKEAYRRIGFDISTQIFPAERALTMSNSGEVDGEVNRIFGLEKKYSNLVRVPVAINRIEGVAFTKKRDLKITNWDSLQPFSLGLRIGAKFAETGTEGMNVTAVATNEQVFTMLGKERVEIAVSTRIEGLLTAQKLGLKDIFVLKPPLANLELFHYLHKKHAALIPQLTAALKDMQKEGRIQSIKKAAFQKLFGG